MPTQQQWRKRLQGDNEWNPLPEGNSEGFWNPEPTPLPRSSPSPAATPGGTRGVPGLRGDNSNAGFVNRHLFDNESNRQFWSTEDPAESLTASAGVNRSLDGFGAGLQGAYPFGEPTVQIPTSDAPTLNLDNAPSLFGGANPTAVNPFDEWWRQGEPTFTQGEASAFAEADLSGASGSMWADLPPVRTESGDANLVAANDSPVSQENPNFNPMQEDSGLQVEPDALNQDYEWTTSPGDRRFLNTPNAEELAPSTGDDPNAGRLSIGGNAMSGFGGDMSLGSNLNTPLALMNYGGGYPQGGGRRGDGLMTGVVTAGGQVDSWGNQIDDVGGRWVDRPDGSGADWVESARSNPNGRPPTNDGTGTTTIQIPTQQQQGGLAGLTVIGHDTRTGAPIYRDAQGNQFVDPGSGTKISPGVAAAMRGGDYESAYGPSSLSRHASAVMQMANASNLMQIRGNSTGEAGRTSFYPGPWGRPNVTLEGGAIVRQPGGRTIGRGGNSASYAGGLG